MISRFRVQLSVRMMERLASRGDVIMNFLANALILFLTYFFWKALSANSAFRGTETDSTKSVLTYIVLATILRSSIVTFGTTARVGSMVQDGSIVGILIKPISFLEYWLAELLSRAVFSLFTLTLPLTILISIVEPRFFNTNLYYLTFLLSTILAFYISSILNITMGLLAFWFERSVAFHQINIILYEIASGMLVPIYIYPDYLKHVINWLPYRTIIDIPLQTLLNGHYTLIFIQLAWASILTILYTFIYRTGYKHLEVVGA